MEREIDPASSAAQNRSHQLDGVGALLRQASIGLLLDALDARLLAGNLLFWISLNASALLVGLREPSLGLRDYLAVGEGLLVVSALAVGHCDNMATPGSHRRRQTVTMAS